jgi:hypothetical protein
MGKMKIHPQYAANIINAIMVSDELAEKFNEVVTISYNAWLRQPGEMEEEFPAFNRNWLASQPEEKQAELLLRAFIKKEYLSEGNKGMPIAFEDFKIGLPIANTRISNIAKRLNLSPDEAGQLKAIIELSQKAFRALYINPQKTKIGAISRASQNSELLPPDKDKGQGI